MIRIKTTKRKINRHLRHSTITNEIAVILPHKHSIAALSPKSTATLSNQVSTDHWQVVATITEPDSRDAGPCKAFGERVPLYRLVIPKQPPVAANTPNSSSVLARCHKSTARSAPVT